MYVCMYVRMYYVFTSVYVSVYVCSTYYEFMRLGLCVYIYVRAYIHVCMYRMTQKNGHF